MKLGYESLEDLSTLRYVHELAMEFDKGQDIKLIPDLEDPGDPFGMKEAGAE